MVYSEQDKKPKNDCQELCITLSNGKSKCLVISYKSQKLGNTLTDLNHHNVRDSDSL